MPVSELDLGITRNGGLTHVLDKGLGPRGWEDVLDTAGDFIDIVKLGWGTAYVTHNLERKLEVLREKPVVIGGTFFEVVYARGKFDEYKRWLTDLGLTHVEISDGTIDIPRDRKLELIEDFARDFTVLSEVGSKDAEAIFAPYQWVEWIKAELEAGAWKVITEGREGGTSGIYRADRRDADGPRRRDRARDRHLRPDLRGAVEVLAGLVREALRARASTSATSRPTRSSRSRRSASGCAATRSRRCCLAASLQLPADVEGMAAEQVLGFVLEAVPRPRLARLLLPEGGVGAARHALRARAEGARLRARHARALPRDVRGLARGREALRHEGRGVRGAVARAAGGGARRRAVGAKPDLCCSIRKVEPLNRALAGLDCWITGLRRDQSPARADAPKLGWDEAHELWKANPLADWTDERCWAYVNERDLPVNPLHERGTRRSAARTAPRPARA